MEKFKAIPDDTYQTLLKTVEFATLKHHGQLRKHTGEPYIVHCLRVAQLVTHVGEPAMSVAILHDTVEDTNTTYQELVDNFGTVIADTVMELTDPPKEFGNRAARKAKAREQITSYIAKCVKCADTIDNLPSIAKHDPDFAKVYVKEKTLMLDTLADAEQGLYYMLLNVLAEVGQNEK